ncbi:MAG: iron-sulfur cluster assembly accessory protein [Gammaproteobacteria bacterium]|nr:iron-sulfur cluster assembly accessory protein [Gammaproteobacteria bacterium]
MSESAAPLLTDTDLTLSGSAEAKMAELVGQVEDDIEGVRVYATPGGCSGISFGMTFTDQLGGNDNVLAFEGFNLVVDSDTMQYLKGVEIDYVDRGDGAPTFVFNNLQPVGGGCGTCGSSQGGGCS